MLVVYNTNSLLSSSVSAYNIGAISLKKIKWRTVKAKKVETERYSKKKKISGKP